MSSIPSAVAVFHSGDKDRPDMAQDDLCRRVRARKRAYPVHVRFAEHACEVATLEGVVHASPGDAIVTGPFGELWPVPSGSFAGKYQAVSPLEMGASGRYMSLPIDVVAVRMGAPFEVVLADGHSRLMGRGGDWLIDYGDGNLGIVNADIFDATYDILESN